MDVQVTGELVKDEDPSAHTITKDSERAFEGYVVLLVILQRIGRGLKLDGATIMRRL